MICSKSLHRYASRSINSVRSLQISGIAYEKGINPDVEFHSRLANQWWDDEKNLLHRFNEVRVPFIMNGLRNFGSMTCIRDTNQLSTALNHLKILDVGCGGGILSEALARMPGNNVVGIDPSMELITIAKKHLEKMVDLKDRVNYVKSELHSFADGHCQEFDVVIASEVIEHVYDKEKFVWNCLRCLKPNGSLFITTPNKTLYSKYFVVKVAEGLKFVPKGTHDFNRFITPENLTNLLKKLNSRVLHKEGFFYQFWSQKFVTTTFDKLLYGIHARKL